MLLLKDIVISGMKVGRKKGFSICARQSLPRSWKFKTPLGEICEEVNYEPSLVVHCVILCVCGLGKKCGRSKLPGLWRKYKRLLGLQTQVSMQGLLPYFVADSSPVRFISPNSPIPFSCFPPPSLCTGSQELLGPRSS